MEGQLMVGQRIGLFLSALLVAGTAAGCSKAADNGTGKPEAGKTAGEPIDVIDKPVTLKIAAQVSDDLFPKFIADPVKKKFPNVTLEQIKVQGNASPKATATMLSQGNMPDIILSLPGWYGEQKLQDFFSDLTPLIKKYNFDTDRLYPGVLETVKSYSPSGAIEFLPESMTGLILLYNKSIFDRFGVPYPKDGMTWEEAIDLAKKVTRSEGGTAYRGLDVLRDFNINNTQLSLPFVDQKTTKGSINTDGWKRYFTMMKSLYDIQGNTPQKQLGNFEEFAKGQKLAMFVGRMENITQLVAESGDLNWDMVTVPTYKELPKIGTQVNAPFYAIPPTSTQKDEAFKVIAYLLSDEIQLANNKEGRLTVLKSEQIRKQFGTNIKELSGKHIDAALALAPAKPRSYTLYDNLGVVRLQQALSSVAVENKDINTALREAEELLNKDIEANKK
jgi:multiple sugar transport system substrate-binding protein